MLPRRVDRSLPISFMLAISIHVVAAGVLIHEMGMNRPYISMRSGNASSQGQIVLAPQRAPIVLQQPSPLQVFANLTPHQPLPSSDDVSAAAPAALPPMRPSPDEFHAQVGIASPEVSPAIRPHALPRPQGIRAPSAASDNLPPVYPEVAVEKQWEGTVALRIEIRPDGKAGSVRIVSSSGHGILDDAAVEAARAWRFSSPGETGESVILPVRFVLRG